MTLSPTDMHSSRPRFHPSARDGKTPQSQPAISSATSCWLASRGTSRTREPIGDWRNLRAHASLSCGVSV